MSRLLPRALALLAAACLAGCTPAPNDPTPTPTSTIAASSARVSVEVDGGSRDFLVRSPQHTEGERLPAIVALHGAGGNGAEFERLTGFTKRIERDHFLVAYPDGTSLGASAQDGQLAWNAGTCCGAAVREDIDDIGFLDTLLTTLANSYDADPDRIYLAGFSNGGMLAYRAACELGDRISGIAVVGGALNVDSCASSERMPVLILHGTDDQTVPYRGGNPLNVSRLGLKPWANSSVAEAVAAWLERDGCADSPTTTEDGAVTRDLYLDCEPGSYVDLRSVNGGTHTWFRAKDGPNATRIIEREFLVPLG